MGTTTVAAGNGTSQINAAMNAASGSGGAVPTTFATAIKYDVEYRAVTALYLQTGALTFTQDVTGAKVGGATNFAFQANGSAVNTSALGRRVSLQNVDITAGQVNIVSAWLEVGGVYLWGATLGALNIPPPAAPVWTTQNPPDVVVGAVVNYTFVATGATSYAVATGALPTGLTLNAGTGALTGTVGGSPTTANFTLNATNAGGTTASGAIDMVISAAGASPITYLNGVVSGAWSSSGSATTSVVTTTVPTGAKVGLFVAQAETTSATCTSVSDGVNTYTLAESIFGGFGVFVYKCLNPVAGTRDVTATWSAAVAYRGFGCAGYFSNAVDIVAAGHEVVALLTGTDMTAGAAITSPSQPYMFVSIFVTGYGEVVTAGTGFAVLGVGTLYAGNGFLARVEAGRRTSVAPASGLWNSTSSTGIATLISLAISEAP